MDIKVISTIILSLGPIVSAVLIALFNNIHLTRIHQSEMDQNQKLKKLEILQQAESIQLNTYYSDKKKAYADFIKSANDYIALSRSYNTFVAVTANANNALLYCSAKSQDQLISFIDYISSNFIDSGVSDELLADYNAHLRTVCLVLRNDLEETKPSYLLEAVK